MTDEYYTTEAEGRYQVRFVEKACYDKEMVYCNSFIQLYTIIYKLLILLFSTNI